MMRSALLSVCSEQGTSVDESATKLATTTMLGNKVPWVVFLRLPDTETGHSHIAATCLQKMARIVDQFGYALDLRDESNARRNALINHRKQLVALHGPISGEFETFRRDFLNSLHRFGEWTQMSARECAMLIHDFHRAMGSAKSNIEKTTELKSRTHPAGMDTAFALFAKYFPDAGLIRNAALHGVDFFSTPNRAQGNSIDGPFSSPGIEVHEQAGIAISQVISGETVTYTGYHKPLSFEMSRVSVERLSEIGRLFFSAFREPADGEQAAWLS